MEPKDKENGGHIFYNTPSASKECLAACFIKYSLLLRAHRRMLFIIFYLDELPPEIVDKIQQLADECNISLEAMFNDLLKTGIKLWHENQ